MRYGAPKFRLRRMENVTVSGQFGLEPYTCCRWVFFYFYNFHKTFIKLRNDGRKKHNLDGEYKNVSSTPEITKTSRAVHKFLPGFAETQSDLFIFLFFADWPEFGKVLIFCNELIHCARPNPCQWTCWIRFMLSWLETSFTELKYNFLFKKLHQKASSYLISTFFPPVVRFIDLTIISLVPSEEI